MKYPNYIMESVRQNLGLDKNDITRDKDITEMSKTEILAHVTAWDGIIGYTHQIKAWIQDIYGVELKD